MIEQAQFFDPQEEIKAKADIERRRAYAQQLRENAKPTGNEMVSGIVVKKSPLEGLVKMLQSGMAGYNDYKATEAETQSKANQQKLLAEALGKYGQDPNAAAQMLMQSPEYSGMGAQLMTGNADREREYQDKLNFMRESYPYELEKAKALAQVRAKFSTPTNTEQDTNNMMELYRRAKNPNLTQQERDAAAFEYNLYGQNKKAYGWGQGTYQDISSNVVNYDGIAPYSPDPLQASQEAIQNRQADIGINPMQNPSYQQPSLSPIAGFNEIMAKREGLKSEAKVKSEAMPAPIVKEQDEIIGKINTSQSLEGKMNKFIGQIDSGKLDLGMIENIQNKARNNLKLSTEESRNLASFNAELEAIRNESLRLNNGVQTDGDARRAWNELVTNINDPQVVRQRLSEIADINRKGAILQKQRLDIMRAEYSRDPLEINNIYGQNQPSMQTPQGNVFNTVEEATSANLPVGTEIIINGRRAIVE